jgi:hypothetical protein
MKQVATIVVLCFAIPAHAGLYSPDEPFAFEIDSDGFARPLQYAGGFENALKELRQAATLPKVPGEAPNEVRKKHLQRVDQRQSRGVERLAPEELAGYTSDLIRVNKPNDVLNILQPFARDPRRGGFLANTHLAAAHVARGEYREAADQQQQALLSGFPESFAKLTKAELAWLKRVEREYYWPMLTRRAEEARTRPSSDRREEPDALFTKRGSPPIQFVGEDGRFVPGKLSAKEREKLPKDAIAIVQQILLWHPYDARLFWLLGELYNAEGDIETAAKILDECSYGLSYTNPNMMQHRQKLKEAAVSVAAERIAEAERKAADQKKREDAEAAASEERKQQVEQTERDYQKRKQWILAIAVAIGVLLVYYQSREFIRRLKRRR